MDFRIQIPFQFQFNPDIKSRLSSADNNLFMAKNDFANKKYSQAILNSDMAKVLVKDALAISTELTEQMEAQIISRLKSLKTKSNSLSASFFVYFAPIFWAPLIQRAIVSGHSSRSPFSLRREYVRL